MVFVLGLEIGCLTPLSTIFQLYRGVKFIGGGWSLETREDQEDSSRGFVINL